MKAKFRKLMAGLLASSCLISPFAGAHADIPPGATPAILSAILPTLLLAAKPATLSAPNPAPKPAPKPIAVPRDVLRINPKAAQQCGPITGGAPSPVIENRIKDFTTQLKKSQTGRDLLAAAADYENGKPAWMCFAELRDVHALYYTGRGVLAVGIDKTNDEVTGDAVHELRHLFQEKTGLFDIPASEKNDRIHLEYAGEADAEAVSALVMWELKEAGTPGPWNHHNNHHNYGPRSICYAHISTSFRKAVEGGLAPALATQHAFRAWYRDQSLLSYYEESALTELNRAQKKSEKESGQAAACRQPM